MYIKRQIFISKNIIKILGLSVCWQSVLAIWQWLKQGSVFGYWFLGEQPFNTATLAIKKIFFLGQVKILAMGTFPHPNILAGFLVISLTLIFNEFSISKFLKNIASVISFILGSIALFLTFSYTAIAAFLFLIFINLIKNRKKAAKWLSCYLVPALPRILGVTAGIILLITVVLMIKNQGWRENYYSASSWSRRNQLNKIAFDLWLTSPIFGVGLGNFIPRMEEFGQIIADYRFLQPVHNIFLLVLTEMGIVGEISLISLIWLINKRLLRQKNYCLLLTVYCLLFLGLFDHYWLTIQQGMLGTSMVLGLFVSGRKFKS